MNDSLDQIMQEFLLEFPYMETWVKCREPKWEEVKKRLESLVEYGGPTPTVIKYSRPSKT